MISVTLNYNHLNLTPEDLIHQANQKLPGDTKIVEIAIALLSIPKVKLDLSFL